MYVGNVGPNTTYEMIWLPDDTRFVHLDSIWKQNEISM